MPRITAERREERRQQIIQATLRCAIRLGLHHVTMAEVISESGLSAGAVYGYFATKDELLTAVADSKLGMLNGVFTEMLADGATCQRGAHLRETRVWEGPSRESRLSTAARVPACGNRAATASLGRM